MLILNLINYVTINPTWICSQFALMINASKKIYAIQKNNTNLPNIGIGSEDVRGVNYNGTFVTHSTDDDWIGIIFGYESSSNFYLMHGTKFNVSNDYHKGQQFKITKVNSDTGVNGPDMKNALYNSTSVPGQTEILWKDKRFLLK